MDRESLSEALRALIHRGPDDQGHFSSPPVFLGIRRLSIIDIDGGKQPLTNEDGTIVVVFNGEIYNHVELRKDLIRRGHTFRTRCDTEVLVHLYEEAGPDLCRRLVGMFAFAIWDSRQRILVLGRDRFGKKPLYYSRTPGGGLIFASELKALQPLARGCGYDPAIDPQAIYDFLSIGVVPQPSTIWKGVSALPAASWLRFDGTNLELKSYWSLDYQPKLRIGYGDALRHVRELVAEAVQARLESDVPLGVFLSGGIDSSIVTWEAAQHIGTKLQTFTIQAGDDAFDESPIARRTAAHFGVQSTVLRLEVTPRAELERLVRQYDQPFADPSAIPSMAIARLARQHVTVVLNGDGGDEVFAGYRRYLAVRAAELLPSRIARMLACIQPSSRLAGRHERRTPAGFWARFTRGLELTPPERYITWTTDLLLEKDKARAWRAPPQRSTEDLIESMAQKNPGPLDTQLSTDIQIILPSALLVKMDMATMAASLEARSPLLDHRIAEFTARLPSHFKVRYGRLKPLLRDAYRNCLPEEVLRGPKRGFEIPLQKWLEGELREVVLDSLLSPSAKILAYLDQSFIKKVLEKRCLTDHNWALVVYSLLVMELWLQQQ